MIHRYRTLLFLLFTATFFATAGSVLFYASGYRFSFERGIFIYTGSLSLKTNVKTVDIKIDNERIPEKELGILNNSIQIAGLNPGEHFVEVSAPGYRTWGKKFVIGSGLTTEFWNIYLTEESYERQAIAETEHTLKMFPAPNGLFATVKQNDTRYSVDILNIGGDENEEVFATTEAVFLPALETNIEWSPESHKLIIPLIKDTEPFYVITDIETKEFFSLNERVGITTPLQAPRWDATSRDFLFFLSENTLYRFDTTLTKAADPVATNVTAYDLSGNSLYYLSSQDGLIYEIDGDGQDTRPKKITTLPVHTDTSHTHSLIMYDEARVALIDEDSGKLMVFNKKAPHPWRELGSGVKSLQYSDDGKKLLFYTEHEISVYFNQNWESQPFRALDSVMQIARFSTPMKNVQWAEDYEHVIFSLGKNIKMIELDNRDRRDLADLLTLDVLPHQILSRFGSDTLYVVLETSSDALAGNTVFGINLPQYANIFGL